jgi:hypothetical protein
VTDEGQVSFWWGSISPSASQISGSYGRLRKTVPAQVFPIRFASDVPIIGGEVSGELPGFLHLEDLRTRRTRAVR